jgi:hypothetical protein
MNSQQPEAGILLARLIPPLPPTTLRDQTLDAARMALARPLARDRWARIYSSRLLRLAWATAVVVLIVANFVLPKSHRSSPGQWFVNEVAWRSPELDEALTFPRLRELYVNLGAFADRRPTAAGSTPDGRPSKEKS